MGCGPFNRRSFSRVSKTKVSHSMISSSRVEAPCQPAKKKVVDVNPQPDNYKILGSKTVNKLLIVEIKYPNCTNFEGKKILVFKGVTIEQLNAQKLIDPHFSKSTKFIHPIARFVPTPDGMTMAECFCESYKG